MTEFICDNHYCFNTELAKVCLNMYNSDLRDVLTLNSYLIALLLCAIGLITHKYVEIEKELKIMIEKQNENIESINQSLSSDNSASDHSASDHSASDNSDHSGSDNSDNSDSDHSDSDNEDDIDNISKKDCNSSEEVDDDDEKDNETKTTRSGWFY